MGDGEESDFLTQWLTKIISSFFPFKKFHGQAESLKLVLGLPQWLSSKEPLHLPAMQETWVISLGQEDSLEKEMATHSSILAWRIPRTEEPGGLQSMGSQRVRHNWAWNWDTSLPSLQVASLLNKITFPFSWQTDGERVETVTDFIWGGSKITADGDWSHEIKDTCSLEEKLWQT